MLRGWALPLALALAVVLDLALALTLALALALSLALALPCRFFKFQGQFGDHFGLNMGPGIC